MIRLVVLWIEAEGRALVIATPWRGTWLVIQAAPGSIHTPEQLPDRCDGLKEPLFDEDSVDMVRLVVLWVEDKKRAL